MTTEAPIIKPQKNTENLLPGDVLISNKEIQERLSEVATDIAAIFENKNLVIVGLLQGARIVTDELEELLSQSLPSLKKQFITARSYQGTESVGLVEISEVADLDVEGMDVLLCDDILDTGLTLIKVREVLLEKKARSVSLFVLLSKQGTRKVDIESEFTCFKIPPIWVQGHGMDSDGQGRENPDIIFGPYYEEQAVLA